MTVRVIGPRDPRVPGAVNTTSRSTEAWSRGLSPFFVGPVPLYPGAGVAEATCVENAWQFSKVYPDHVPLEGPPSQAYWEWARKGWRDRYAHRYPRGRGAVPAFSWWAGEALDYLTARRRIYIPLYGRAVVQTAAWRQLSAQYRRDGSVTLWDFDGYDHRAAGMTYADVAACPTRKMGHAFVLALLLEWEVRGPGAAQSPVSG